MKGKREGGEWLRTRRDDERERGGWMDGGW